MRKFNRQDAKNTKTNFQVLKNETWRLGDFPIFTL